MTETVHSASSGNPEPLRVAILLGAEPYQTYHVADIAWELASRTGIQVEILSVLPQSLREMERLTRDARDRNVPRRLLHTPPLIRVLQRLSFLGSLKTHVMHARANRSLLSSFDAIVTPTDHAHRLGAVLLPRPIMIYSNHGIGGRAAAYAPYYRDFDFALLSNHRDEERLLEKRFIRPGHYAVIGYPKLETAERLAKTRPRLFGNDRPVVLFNPHSKRSLRSWDRLAAPLIEHVTRTGEFNLIVAPHAKLFARRPKWLWRRWERRAVVDCVIVDLGSDRSLDMTYTLAADIYVGDVSSQVYEFLSRPKPCVFMNAHHIDWRRDRDFLNWELGDVVETLEAAIEAIRQAQSRHHLYEVRQRQRIEEAIDRSPGAAARAADAIAGFLLTTRGLGSQHGRDAARVDAHGK